MRTREVVVRLEFGKDFRTLVPDEETWVPFCEGHFPGSAAGRAQIPVISSGNTVPSIVLVVFGAGLADGLVPVGHLLLMSRCESIFVGNEMDEEDGLEGNNSWVGLAIWLFDSLIIE